MAGIFISYRRDDSQGFAGRLADDLGEILGQELVFRDIEIPAGSDFTDVLHRAIAASDALLVVIGRQWAADAPNAHRSRLFEPTDWVRTEIEAALAQGKQLIPVLVSGAQMPTAASLPGSIQRLTRLQAATLTDRHWDAGVADLATRLRMLCPALAAGRLREAAADQSPAEVLRELGDRFLDKVAPHRRPRIEPPRLPATFMQGLVRGLGRGLRKLASVVVGLTLIYVGVRLFGDDPMLRHLDAFEARLQIGWERLQAYLGRL